MANQLYEGLRLTAVGCPSDVTLPSLKSVSKALSQQLSDIGMSGEELESEITNTFVLRERNQSDPQYSLDSLKESKTDILGSYRTDQNRQSEITLFVDSCSRASTDLSLSPFDLLQIVLIHELAQHATAWATIEDEDKDLYEWIDYNQCNSDPWPSVHEFFAQALSFLCIAEHQKELLGAFRKLSRYQPSIYRTWEVFDASTQKKVPLHSIRETLKGQFLPLMRSIQPVGHGKLHTDAGAYEE
jgi:hypothetical protein